ncbi:hypothetical protein [Streptomyces inusitatus]|uniref:hypothetical protein n=1 Tax=Streptomyces inusitatus TaxID=68221 RepID=UPI00167D72DD|nr:hypothetical protein [Streptomyces inusitatus]
MTMRVYRMSRGGERPVSPTVVVGGPGGPPVPPGLMVSSAYPPCCCARCSGLRTGGGR